MFDYESLIRKFYVPGGAAYRLLTEHSRQVAELAMRLIDNMADDVKATVDRDFVYEAAMLHDIGMFMTYAPSIYCYGNKPYLCHGYMGRELLDILGLHRYAMVCEHHTGSGLTVSEIEGQGLPLPKRDMLPTTIEERLVCYADKFYSKSKICAAKPTEKVREQLSKFGVGTLSRFDAMVQEFGRPEDLKPEN